MIQSAIDDYLEMITQLHRPRTVKIYATGLKFFAAALKNAKLDPLTTDVAQLNEDGIKVFIKVLCANGAL